VGAATAAKDSEAGLPLTVPETGAAQLALPHTVPGAPSWHPPAPLHLPVLPQGRLAAQVLPSLGVPLAGIELQVPSLGATQLWHAPLHTASQHTPSALHTSLVQSELALQPWPFASLLPHWLLVLRQVSPPVQSVSAVHVVRHEGLVRLHW
jgi:hypothetical protein